MLTKRTKREDEGEGEISVSLESLRNACKKWMKLVARIRILAELHEKVPSAGDYDT